MRSGLFAIFLAACALLVLGCGGSSNSRPITPPESLLINPSEASVAPNGTVALAALAQGGEGDEIEWSVAGPAGATVSDSGVFRAGEEQGIYTVTARFRSRPDISATARVEVTNGITIAIEDVNDLPFMVPNSSLQLRAEVQGTDNENVVWTVVPGEGSVDSEGNYTAPAFTGFYTVTAAAQADLNKRASVTIQVVDNLDVRMAIAGKGDILIELNRQAAPITVANFVTLVNNRFYDDILFHRYEPNFVVQGGDPLTKELPLTDPSIGTGGPGYTIPFENTGLLHVPYAIAMASTGPGVGGGSQFYFSLGAQPALDGDYAVFGVAAQGQSVVDALRRGDRITSARTVRR